MTDSIKQDQYRNMRIRQIQAFYPSPGSYRPVMADQERNEFYTRALRDTCRDKVVLDIGAGLGLLSLFALREGAKKVYAVEVNPIAVDILRKLKEQENLENLIIIDKPTWDIELEEQVDIIVHEIFGPFLLDEMCLHSIDDVKKFLKPNGRMIPERFGFDFKFFNSDSIPSIHYLAELSGVYDSTMQGNQTIIEEYIEDDGNDWIEFGPWDFLNVPEERVTKNYKFNKETQIDSLWVRPFLLSGKHRLNLNKTKPERHWGNSFLRFGRYAIMDQGVDIRLMFEIDEDKLSFNTGIDLPVGG